MPTVGIAEGKKQAVDMEHSTHQRVWHRNVRKWCMCSIA